jgi:signal transduction histidine kinase/ABC-type amino acid transport substrate-binding protein
MILLRGGGCVRGVALVAWSALAGALSAADPSLQLSEAEQRWIDAHHVIRIQMGDCSPPFEFRENGVWKGLAYDYLVEAGNRLGLTIEPTGIHWADALAAIQVPGPKRDVDLLLAVTHSPERERQALLTAPYVSFPQVIFASKQHPFISGLKDLATSRLVVEHAYVMEGWLRRDLPQARITALLNPEDCLNAVSSGQADAYVGNLATASWLIDKLGLTNIEVVAPSGYGDEGFSMAIRKDWPELVALLDKAIAAIPPAKQQAMHQKWLSVRYEYGLRTEDIVKWVVIVAGVALVFIVQLRRMVARRTDELKRQVELRRAQEAHLSESQRLASLGSWTRDVATGAIAWSDETCRIFGRQPGHQPTMEEFLAAVHPEDLGSLRVHQAKAADGWPYETEYRIVRPDREVRHLLERCRCVAESDVRPARLEGIVLDITERKRAEEERERLERSIRHTEKLRVIGQLASGIAHDFNNQLGGITGYADLLKGSLAGVPAERAPVMRRYVDGILLASERAAAITGQLRVFSRAEGAVRGQLDLHQLIRESAELAARGTAGAMTLALELRASPSAILGDPAQIQTALVNLALNARDAMPSGGTLAISSRSLDLAVEIPGAHHFDFKPGPFVEVTVRDTGCGMDEAVLARLFEPFFTTKEVGKGTGLGLANVYGCLKNHGGAIAIESRVSEGSTFRLYFPAAGVIAVTASEPTPVPVRGDASILLIDDDAPLRRVASDMLAQLGYRVEAVASGREAVARLTARQSAYDLVIVDMIMPEMDGLETIAQLRALEPEVRVLLCSGSFRNELAHPIPEADGFLQKPFMLGPLSRQVEETLRVRRSGA